MHRNLSMGAQQCIVILERETPERVVSRSYLV